jgi:amidase
VTDLRLALGVLAGPDDRDTDVPPVPLAAPHRVTLSGLRLAVAPTVPGTPVAAGLRHQVERVATQASEAGAKVEERLPDVEWEQLYELFQDLLSAITGLYDPSSDLRDEQRTLAWYLEALARRDRFVTAWQEFFADVDALIAAPAMTTAFPHRDDDSAIDVDGQPVSYLGNGAALVYTNLTGLPGLVAPAGLDGGLPVGVQIIGPRWSESRLLDIAEALEQAEILPGFQAPAGYGQHRPPG